MKRFLSVDIAKGMSIIAIVFGHIAYQYPFVNWLIRKICLSIFGMLSYSSC